MGAKSGRILPATIVDSSGICANELIHRHLVLLPYIPHNIVHPLSVGPGLCLVAVLVWGVPFDAGSSGVSRLASRGGSARLGGNGVGGMAQESLGNRAR